VFQQQLGGLLGDGRVRVEGHPRVPGVQRRLVEPHARHRGQRQRLGQEPEVDAQRLTLVGGQRLVRRDQPAVVLDEPGGLFAGAHGVPPVPHPLVGVLTGDRGAVPGRHEDAEADLGPAAQVREDLRERPLGGAGRAAELLVGEVGNHGGEHVVAGPQGRDRAIGQSRHDRSNHGIRPVLPGSACGAARSAKHSDGLRPRNRSRYRGTRGASGDRWVCGSSLRVPGGGWSTMQPFPLRPARPGRWQARPVRCRRSSRGRAR
jgi:hypothetical protein